MNTQVQININKNKKNWSVETTVQYPGWPANSTHSGGHSLAHALWSTLGNLPANSTLTTLNVNGKPLAFTEAYRIIHKCLSGGGLAYKLPEYKKILS